MNRRRLMFAVIAAAVSAGIAVQTVARNADSAAVFLQDVYARETERHNKRLSPDNDGFYALFTRETRELMSAPRVALPRRPIGPILHALYGRGVLPGTEVVFGDAIMVRNDQDLAILDIALTVRSEVRRLTVTLRWQNSAWRIHDIEYAPGDTLTGHYRRITGR